MSRKQAQGRYAAVLFDVGQTLLRVDPSVGQVYASVAGRHGVSAAANELEAAFRRLWTQLRGDFTDNRGYRTSEMEERQWWLGIVDGVFREVSLRDAFGDFDSYFDEVFELFASPGVWHVYDDVAPALDYLEHAGMRTAVISNWDQRLHVLLDRLGLKRRFEFVVASADIGHRKPHPLIFQNALERMGLSADKVVYVGDSYEDDVVGARTVGMTPLLLDRHRGCSTADCLGSLNDLPQWLAGALRR